MKKNIPLALMLFSVFCSLQIANAKTKAKSKTKAGKAKTDNNKARTVNFLNMFPPYFFMYILKQIKPVFSSNFYSKGKIPYLH